MTKTIIAALAILAPAPVSAQGAEAILQRDQSLSRAVTRGGLVAGLEPALADDVVLVYAGAPVIVGRAGAMAHLRAQRGLDSLVIAWTPVKAWVSAKKDFAITIGTGTVTPKTPGASSRPLGYIAAWKKAAGGSWRLAALMLNGVGGGAADARFSKVLPGTPAAGPAAGMIQADLDFSARAGQVGAAEAFRAFAAPDALNLGAAGPRRGPDEIAAGLAGGPPADWNWFPVAAGASAAGDLGFTVGQAVIAPKSGAANLSKYLTAWQRQADGSYRFVSDGGNARPAP